MNITTVQIDRWRKGSPRPSDGQTYQWAFFTPLVYSHIRTYAIPQYGDSDTNEQWREMTVDQVKSFLLKYVQRINSGQRGTGENLRDCFKIAHLAMRLFLAYLHEGNEEKDKTYECPHCHQNAGQIASMFSNSYGIHFFFLVCDNCGTQSDWHDTPQEAVDEWKYILSGDTSKELAFGWTKVTGIKKTP